MKYFCVTSHGWLLTLVFNLFEVTFVPHEDGSSSYRNVVLMMCCVL